VEIVFGSGSGTPVVLEGVGMLGGEHAEAVLPTGGLLQGIRGVERVEGPTQAPEPPCEFRRVRYDRGTRKFGARSLCLGQKARNRAHSGLRAPGERANAELKNWRILRKIRSSPAHTTNLVDAIQTLIIKS
jgi:hypothetical protein